MSARQLRTVTELYLRAYWPYYLTGVSWAVGVSALWPR